MKKILIIEDDKVTANIYCNKFRVEGYEVEIAPDGNAGLLAVKRCTPDIVMLDLMMPKVSGVDVIKAIRACEETKTLPVIVFSNSYLSTMIQDAWKAGATKCLSKSDCTPKHMLEVIANIFAAQLHPGGVTDIAKTGQSQYAARNDAELVPVAPAGHTQLFSRGTVESAPAVESRSTTMVSRIQPSRGESHTQVIAFDTEVFKGSNGESEVLAQAFLRKNFFDNSPNEIAILRQMVGSLSKSEDPGFRPRAMPDLARRLHALANGAGILSFRVMATFCSAMEAFTRELGDKADLITTSSLRTLAQATDYLSHLLDQCRLSDAGIGLSPHILVVDDEPISRHALIQALGRADLRSIQIDDPLIALNILEKNRFDLIFLDVDMPGMSGFELCAKLRALPDHAKTPVIFVTSNTDFSSRAKSTLSGGSDFIGKPFLFMEVAVKALTHYLRSQEAQKRSELG